MKFHRKSRALSALIIIPFLSAACASSGLKNSKVDPFASPLETAAPATAPSAQNMDNSSRQIADLKSRLDALESKMLALTQKWDSAKAGFETLLNNQKANSAPVVSHPAELGGSRVETSVLAETPDSGFVFDEPVRSYKKAMILFNSQQFAEAAAAFSEFLEKYPDHPLAGMAQFYVGESYLMQSEFKLAVQEFQRVLTSYDRSAYVAQSLREMADAEDQLRKTEDAAKHRQMLKSLFPHSPYAMESVAKRGVPDIVDPVRETADPVREARKPQPKLDEPPLTEPFPRETDSPNTTVPK